MSPVQTGDRVNNYLLEERVGTGSFGEVWKARHHIFDEIVAVKVPTDAEYVHNLRREGVAVHGLKHPNIVRALDLDPFADPPYLIMEYVDGPSLRTVLDRRPAGLPVVPALNVFRGVLLALEQAHQAGVVHRDLKPANILLSIADRDIEDLRIEDVKVTDFGLGLVGGLTTVSIMQSGSRREDLGGVTGTMAYMSPEQRDGRAVDARSDLYACGVVLFEMLTGSRPQGNDLPSSLRPELQRYLDEIFQRCYTRLENRFAGAAEVLQALHEGPTLSRPPGASPGNSGRAAGSGPCRNCGNGVGPGDQFCIHCGAQLVADIPRCPACQAYTEADDNFCITCGTALRVRHHA